MQKHPLFTWLEPRQDIELQIIMEAFWLKSVFREQANVYCTWLKNLFRCSVVGMEELMGENRGIPVGPLSDERAKSLSFVLLPLNLEVTLLAY